MIDVLMPTHNSGERINLSLLSLWYQEDVHFRLTIRDTGDVAARESRDTRQLLELLEKKVEVRYIRAAGDRLGVVHQRHCLLKTASEEHTLFLDDDIVLDPASLEGMVDCLNIESASFVIPVIVDPDNMREHKDYSATPLSKEAWHNAGMSSHYLRCKEPRMKKVMRGHMGCILSLTRSWKAYADFSYYKYFTGGVDVIASILIADKLGPGVLTSDVEANHFVDRPVRWGWIAMTEAAIKSYLKDKVKKSTLEALGDTAYKKI